MIGVRPDGTKEPIAVQDGYRESRESWKTVLCDLKRRGTRSPVVAVLGNPFDRYGRTTSSIGWSLGVWSLGLDHS